jgi:hypothetical protein
MIPQTAVAYFVQYCQTHIKGDEKGEAQIFLDRFFVMLGYPEGIREVGAECEFRLRQVEGKRSVAFADLFWKGRVLIEMKSRKEHLDFHFAQALNYWNSLTLADKPRYIMLCNFAEFWIYDLNISIHSPADKIPLAELGAKIEAFAFLFPQAQRPLFRLNQEEVTKEAAWYIASLFRSLTDRRILKYDALRYCLQCVVAMFAENIDLLPNRTFTRLVRECEAEANGKAGYEVIPYSYELLTGLFREMNREGDSVGKFFKGVPYFNGGLFAQIPAVELTKQEIDSLVVASSKNWARINPAIFGAIFERGMHETDRHKFGAHFTYETDIQKIVYPVITAPWKEKIHAAEEQYDFDNWQLAQAYQLLLAEIRDYKVLDPSCGSGNFLFVAYRALKRIEQELLTKILQLPLPEAHFGWVRAVHTAQPYVRTQQFYGMDTNEFGVELAKVTLTVAHQMTAKEDFVPNSVIGKTLRDLVLPLDNLDSNIIQTDALFTEWVQADVIVGNPPFQSRSKMLGEFGGEYMNKLWNAYPEVNKYADYCVYWFYKAHRQLKPNQYAGLVATNTIRQNNSRESSLDYIINHGGTIINAVSTQPWLGEAVVYVSIVNWKKGEFEGKKYLYFADRETKDYNLIAHEITHINSSLSLQTDLTGAKPLLINTSKPKQCFMGQKHGHEGFLIEAKEALKLIAENPAYAQVLKPYLIGRELVANFGAQPERFVIDFSQMTITQAKTFKKLYDKIEKEVLPDREREAKEEASRNALIKARNPKAKLATAYQQYRHTWWQLIGKRPELLAKMATLKRYIVCSAVSRRDIFEFICTDIRPNAALIIFAFEDDYSFGILQSKVHWEWWKEKCSTLKGDYRYTIDSVWDTFPFPQQPTAKQVQKVAQASRKLRQYRHEIMKETKFSLREIYRTLDITGKNPLRDYHKALDKAVMECYGFAEKEDLLTQVLALNLDIAAKEAKAEKVQAAGLPDFITDKAEFISDDCVRFE